MKKGYPTKRVSLAAPNIPGRLPPNIGKWEGWDWHTFYMAILTILEKPSDTYRYQLALETVQNLPEHMVFTTPVLAAAWARFSRCFPGRDNPSAYRYMINFLQTTNRLKDDYVTDWAQIEAEWKDLESGEGQLQGVFQQTAPMSDVELWIDDLFVRIPEEFRHTGAGKQIGDKFIPYMMPYILEYVGQYESDMAKANTMNPLSIKTIIAAQWDYYQRSTSTKLKPWHLANINGYSQIYLIKTGKIQQGTHYITEATKTSYKLTINASGQGGTSYPVLIDGMFVGYTPFSISIGSGFLPDVITPGQHLIEAKTIAYQPYKELVIIPSKANAVLDISMNWIPPELREKDYYKLYVTSRPEGAAIIIDNVDTGLITNTYLRVDDTHVKPGTHYCRIAKDGYVAWNGSISVASGQDTNLIFDLQKVPEPPQDPIVAINSILALNITKYKVSQGVLHPDTFDKIVNETADSAMQSKVRTDFTLQNWKDTAYNALVMMNMTRGYVPSLQEIYEATDTYCFHYLTQIGAAPGQGFDTLPGSMYDEVVKYTANQTSYYFLKKTGLSLTENAMTFFQNDARDSLTFFGYKRGK